MAAGRRGGNPGMSLPARSALRPSLLARARKQPAHLPCARLWLAAASSRRVVNSSRHVAHGVFERLQQLAATSRVVPPSGAVPNQSAGPDRTGRSKSQATRTRANIFNFQCDSISIGFATTLRFLKGKNTGGNMEQSNGSSPDRNILCLFDVDGTLTAPREVRERASRRHGAEPDWLSLSYVCMSSRARSQCPLRRCFVISVLIAKQRKVSVESRIFVGTTAGDIVWTDTSSLLLHNTQHLNTPSGMFCNVCWRGDPTHRICSHCHDGNSDLCLICQCVALATLWNKDFKMQNSLFSVA